MTRLVQGSLDGFCGLYALTHLVGESRLDRYDEIVASTFFQLLRSLEAQGRLTAAKIAGPTCGFTDLIIAEAFNAMSVKSRCGLKVIAFRKAAFKKSKYVRNASLVFEKGCRLVVKEDGPNHWVAVSEIRSDGTYKCFDAAAENPRERRARVAWDEGLMIGPQDVIESL